MMIRQFSARIVHWPLRMTRRQGFGDVQSSVPGVILRVEAEGGLIGWGEAATLPAFFGTAEGTAAALRHHLCPLLVGRSAEEAPLLMELADRALAGHPEAKAAIEMALFDIVGKARGVSVAQLLGGIYRRCFPLSVSIANPDIQADIDFARRLLDEGVQFFKMKTGYLSHAEDLARIAQFTAMLPTDARLSLDYNQALPAFDALRQLRDVDGFGLRYIEQPVRSVLHDAMAELSRALDTPLMADESVYTPADALELARRRYAKAIAVKLMKSGGLTRARQVAEIAGAAGMPCFGGTMYEGGIALTAGIHLVAATPNISLGAEFYSANFAFAVDILRQPIRIEGGQLQLPEGAGLGIEIDEGALAAITVAG